MRRSVVRARPLSERELREAEKDNAIGDGDVGCAKGFAPCCETFVDESIGKLHRATCSAVTAERRKAS